MRSGGWIRTGQRGRNGRAVCSIPRTPRLVSTWPAKRNACGTAAADTSLSACEHPEEFDVAVLWLVLNDYFVSDDVEPDRAD
jgi:hypothetical protein